jgi:hypothetical protein
MDKEDAAEHAENVLGNDEARHDDPSDSIKWHNYTEEEERLMKECRDYVRSYINQLNVSLEPEYNRLVSATFTGCEQHEGMCIGLNPDNPKMAEIHEKPMIEFRGNKRPLVEGIEEIGREIVSQNGRFERLEANNYYEAEFHLIVRRT